MFNSNLYNLLELLYGAGQNQNGIDDWRGPINIRSYCGYLGLPSILGESSAARA